jgi:hypothetical protein
MKSDYAHMASLPLMGSRLASFDARRLPPPPKAAEPLYGTPAYREWREQVIARAGRRCEAVVNGRRCPRAEPRSRMFADHKVEVRDGGAHFDIDNGQCLCGSHHTAKTAAARALRR